MDIWRTMDNLNECSLFNDAQKILLIIPDWPLNNIIHQLKRHESDPLRVQKVLLRKLKKVHKNHHHPHSVQNSKRIKLDSEVINVDSEVLNYSDCIISDKNSFNNYVKQQVLPNDNINKVKFENYSALNNVDIHLNGNENILVKKKYINNQKSEVDLFEVQDTNRLLINNSAVEEILNPYDALDFFCNKFMSSEINNESNLKKENSEINKQALDVSLPNILSNTVEDFTNNECLSTLDLNISESIHSITCRNENNITYPNNDVIVVKETDSNLHNNVVKHLNIEYFNFPSTSNTLQNNIHSSVTEKFFVKDKPNNCVQFENIVNNFETNIQKPTICAHFNKRQKSNSNSINNQNMNSKKTSDVAVNKQTEEVKSDSITTMISGIFPSVSRKYIKKLKSDAELSLTNEHDICDHIIDILLKENDKKHKDVPNTSISKNEDVEFIDINSDSSNSVGFIFTDSFSGSKKLKTSLNLSEKVEKTTTSDKCVILTEDMNTEEHMPDSTLSPLVATLLKLFPLAEPHYLKKLCLNKENSSVNVNELISFLLENDYPKRTTEFVDDAEIDEEEQYKLILEVLPDADPSFLHLKCSELYREPEVLKEFINVLLETKRYPTLKDFQRRQKLSAQQKQYTTEFSVEKYLDVIPNPCHYFNDPKRTRPALSALDKLYLTEHFKNYFNNIRVADIIKILKKVDYNPTVAYEHLIMNKSFMKTTRKPKILPDYAKDNILLLQELAYLEHQDEIKEFMLLKAVEKVESRKIAKLLGHMKTCECCYSEEVMPEDSRTCTEGHVFCTDCIVRSVEIAIGDNKTNFFCLAECRTEFSLQTLKDLLKPNIFSKLAQRKMLEEIKAAGIEELESCPFCDFATIPAPGDKIFRCLNNDCMRESCRLCHEPSHIPYRCDEIEKPDEVKARIYIEDKMTEALLRKCWKCGAKFIKETGCNKMTCLCGAMMCYVCSEPVTNYNHFNGQGGSRTDLCPLYSDTDKLHLENVKLMAETAKQEIKNINPSIELKYDPLRGLPEPPKEDKIYKPGNLYVVEEHIRELQNNEGVQFIHQMDNHRPYNNNNNNRRHRHFFY